MKINTSTIRQITGGAWAVMPQELAWMSAVSHNILMGMETEPGEPEPIVGDNEGQFSVIKLHGAIFRDDTPCAFGTRTIAKALLAADADDTVLGHIIHIDSGGGAVNAIEDMTKAMEACQKPIVAFIDGTCGSAAYYIACYADHIIARSEIDNVGCIGVMAEFAGFPKRAKMESGEQYVRIYSTLSSEKNGEYEAAIEGNFAPMIENQLNPLAERFQEAVKSHRPSVTDEQLAGKTEFAKDCVGTLIDEIGELDAALDWLVKKTTIHTYRKMEGFNKLQSLDGLADLQAVDEMVSFNAEQLNTIENALANVDAAAAEMAAAAEQIATLQNEIAEQAAEIANLNSAIVERDQRIAVLESTPVAEPLEPIAEETEPSAPKSGLDTLKDLFK